MRAAHSFLFGSKNGRIHRYVLQLAVIGSKLVVVEGEESSPYLLLYMRLSL